MTDHEMILKIEHAVMRTRYQILGYVGMYCTTYNQWLAVMGMIETLEILGVDTKIWKGFYDDD